MSALYRQDSDLSPFDDNVDEHSSEKSQDAGNLDEKLPVGTSSQAYWVPPEEWLIRLKDGYTGQHGGETLPPGSDPDRVAEAILTMNEEQSVEYLETVIVDHAHDYSFDTVLMQRIKELVRGSEACGLDADDWAYETCKTAGMINNWSPYTEVRAVTIPYDDPGEACESFRAYFLGMFWVCVCTAVNTCKFIYISISCFVVWTRLSDTY